MKFSKYSSKWALSCTLIGLLMLSSLAAIFFTAGSIRQAAASPGSQGSGSDPTSTYGVGLTGAPVVLDESTLASMGGGTVAQDENVIQEYFVPSAISFVFLDIGWDNDANTSTTQVAGGYEPWVSNWLYASNQFGIDNIFFTKQWGYFFGSPSWDQDLLNEYPSTATVNASGVYVPMNGCSGCVTSSGWTDASPLVYRAYEADLKQLYAWYGNYTNWIGFGEGSTGDRNNYAQTGGTIKTSRPFDNFTMQVYADSVFFQRNMNTATGKYLSDGTTSKIWSMFLSDEPDIVASSGPQEYSETYDIYSSSASPAMPFYVPFGDSQASGFKLLAYLQTSGTPSGALTATLYPDDMIARYNASYYPSPVLKQPLQTVTVSGVGSSASWVTATFSTPLVGGDYYWVKFSSSTTSGNPYVVTTNENAQCGCWIKSLSGQNVTIDTILNNNGNNWVALPNNIVYFEVTQTSKANEVAFDTSDRGYDPNDIVISIEYPNGTVLTTATISQAVSETYSFPINSYGAFPFQFAKTVTLVPGIKYQMVFSALPGGDSWGGSGATGITQDFFADYANPASAGYLGQGYFPIFQIGYQTINFAASALATYSSTDLFASPGYQGTTQDAVRFTPTGSETLQSFTVEVIETPAISGDIFNVTLNADNTTIGSHPSKTVIAQASATLASINASFKAGPTNSGYYAWVNMTFTAKTGYTLALTAGTNYWIVMTSPSGKEVILNRLVNPYRGPMYMSENGWKTWGIPADGPSSFSFIIHTSGETYNNAVLGEGEFIFNTGNNFAQSFESPTSFQLKGIDGAFGASTRFIVTMTIQTDSGSDSPSGHILDKAVSVGATNYFQFPVNITASTKYWMVYTVKCMAPCSNPARAYYAIYGLGQGSVSDYGGTSLHYEYLVGSTWTSPGYSARGDMPFILIGTGVTVHVYDTKTLAAEIENENAQSTSYPPKGWNQFLNYEQAQINYNLTQMMSTLSERAFVWLNGMDGNVVNSLPNLNSKYVLTQAGGSGGGFGCVSQPSCGGVEDYWSGDATNKIESILSASNQTNVIGWSSFGAIGDNVGGVTPEDLKQQYLIELPQLATDSTLTANDWCWGLSCHGLNNFTQTAPMRSFGTILNRMAYTGGYYGTNAAVVKVLWIQNSGDGSFASYLEPAADVTTTSDSNSNLTQFGNLRQFNVIVDPSAIESITTSAESRIIAFVKAGGGIVEDSPPATWEDHIMGLSPSSGCCTAPYTVLSGNKITKPYTSLPGYAPYYTGSYTKMGNESAIFEVIDTNGYPVVSSNNYYSGRGVIVDMDKARLSYDSFGDSYTTLLMNAVLYAGHQDSLIPTVWTTTYATTQSWNQIVYTVDGSVGHPLLWVSSNSTSSQTFSINLNATFYGITGSWVAINMQSLSVVASGASSDISISMTMLPFTWAPIYIIDRPANLQPIYSTASITSSSVSSSGGQYATSGPHDASSWVVLSMASSPLSVTSSKSSEPLPAFLTLSAMNSSKIGDYCTSIASGGGCNSFTYYNQQGWYYDSANSLLYIHFQQGSQAMIEVSLSQSSSTTSTETTTSSSPTSTTTSSSTTSTTSSSPTSTTTSSSTTSTTSSSPTSTTTSSSTTSTTSSSPTSTTTSSSTTSTTSSSPTSTTTSSSTTSETTTIASSTVNQTTSAPPSSCEQASSCNQSSFDSTITIQSDAVSPVPIYVDGAAYMTPSIFAWPVGSNHTLILGELSVNTLTGKSKFVGWSGGVNSTSTNLTITVGGDLSLLASYKNQYLVNIVFVDAEGRSVSPQNVSIRGPAGAFNLTDSSLWLYSGTYQVTQAEWMGMDVGSSQGAPVTFAVADSNPIIVSLPIYDETIIVNDVYGLPISGANVTMTVGNQIQELLTNSTGLAVFRQVPLGYLNGTVRYLGFSGNIRVSTPGEHTEYVIVTLSYPVLISILAIGAVGTYFTVRRIRRRPVHDSDFYPWNSGKSCTVDSA